MSMIVFEQEEPLALVDAPAPDVLVFDGEPVLELVPSAGDADFLLFDPESPVSTEVTQDPDFLVIDTPPETQTENVHGLDDFLVFSAPKGDKGDPGVPGPGAVDLVYTFGVPTTSWVIPHGMNTQALNVETVVGGEVVDGDVQYMDDDTITVEWFYPMTGTARLFK